MTEYEEEYEEVIVALNRLAIKVKHEDLELVKKIRSLQRELEERHEYAVVLDDTYNAEPGWEPQ